MDRMDLTTFDKKPEEMKNYLRYNGPHFTERLAWFAIRKMRKDYKKLEPITQDRVDGLLEDAGVEVENAQLCDVLYVANMAYADYWGSSITEDKQLAKYIKDYIDDEDGYDGIAFNRFLADCARKGVVIPWGDVV